MGFFGNDEEESRTNEPEEETYSMDLECDNCTSSGRYDIQMGKTVAEFRKSIICEECGCMIDQPIKTTVGGDEECYLDIYQPF